MGHYLVTDLNGKTYQVQASTVPTDTESRYWRNRGFAVTDFNSEEGDATPGNNDVATDAEIARMAFFYGYLACADRALYERIRKLWDESIAQ